MLPGLRKRSFFPMMEDFFNEDWFPTLLRSDAGANVPAINIVETKDEYRIEVAAPGLGKNDFRIEVEDDTLVISSEKENRTDEDGERYTRREFSYSKFCRTFSLPAGVNKDKIRASHRDGILNISIPRVDLDKGREKKTISIS